MARDRTPPPPAPVYEGYQWLGSTWGRSGRPTPSRIGAVVMFVATVIVLGVAIAAMGEGGRAGFVAISLVVAAFTGVAGAFYLAEARFAARAAREQEPEFPEPPGPSGGPQEE